jgi:hypothetical protein
MPGADRGVDAVQVRMLRRGGALAGAGVLLLAGVAAADTVDADADLVTAGRQSAVHLGTVAPGATVQFDVQFELVCEGSSHVAAGTEITVSLAAVSVPDGGAADASPTTIGPVPAGWPGAWADCPAGLEPVAASGPSTVTLTAPAAEGTDYEYTLMFERTPDAGLSNMTFVEATLDVQADGGGGGGGPDPDPDPDPDPAPEPAAWTAAWEAPLSAASSPLVANHGRVVPLKVELTAAGAVLAPPAGPPSLRLDQLAACGGAVVASRDEGALHWVDGRWMSRLDTSALAPGCWRLTVLVEGDPASGAVELHVVGGTSTARHAGAAARAGR